MSYTVQYAMCILIPGLKLHIQQGIGKIEIIFIHSIDYEQLAIMLGCGSLIW